MDLTLERRPWVPAGDILGELAEWKKEGHPAPDYITLGGSGEPTLNSDMPAVIRGAREMFPDIPVAVLTNSTLMTDPAVREELALADVVLPSMDSLVSREFKRINRPHADVHPDTTARGLLDFRERFAGKIFLEVLLVEGYNDSAQNKTLLADFVRLLAPDRVDVVTMTRPGTLESAGGVSPETLAGWRAALGGEAAKSGRRRETGLSRSTMQREQLRETVLASVRRRPQTAAHLASALGVSDRAVASVLEELVESGAASLDQYGFCRAV